MNGKLVDTNVIIRFLKGQTELFSLFDDMENLYVSSISVGELTGQTHFKDFKNKYLTKYSI